jgi:hypothetical protein
MKTPREAVRRGQTLSELATLSRDPALAFKLDPRFRAQFRNPDEIIEGDFGIHGLTRPYFAAGQSWTGKVSWCRSPKEQAILHRS